MATVVMVINQRDDGDFPRLRRLPVTEWVAEKHRRALTASPQRLKAAGFIGARIEAVSMLLLSKKKKHSVLTRAHVLPSTL